MKLLSKITIILISFLFFQQNIKAQNISNEGSEFWICFPDHLPAGGALASMSVFITSKSNSTGIVTCGTFSKNFEVNANTVIEVQIPRNVSFIGAGTKLFKNKGIKVTVDEGKPKVVVYAHVFAGARSAATLVLPYEALGKKHFAVSYTQAPVRSSGGTSFKSQFNIVAVDANTKVNIKPVINGIAGASFSITLEDIGDVYQFQDDLDITGTLIQVDSVTSGCNRIAAFSGSNAIGIGNSTCDPVSAPSFSLDPLFQQLYPIDSWGKTFPLIPFFNRNSGSNFRIIASEDNTTVRINGSNIVLNEGEFYTAEGVKSVSLLTADKPISVAQFALTQFCSDSRNEFSNTILGDPDMVILNPLEYSIEKITLYSSNKLAISEQYLNVTIPTKHTKSFTINSLNYSSSFIPIPSSPDYSYAQIQLNTIGGSNFSLAADTGFNAIAYGFGNVESYAYSAGTSLASTTIVNALKNGTNDIVKNACVNDEFDFRLLLPYKATKISWQLESGGTIFVQDAPVFNTVVVNKKTLYEFKLLSKKSYSTAGVKPVKIVITLPSSSSICSTITEEIINYNFEVTDLPLAEFTANDKVCIDVPLQFMYVAKSIGTPITSWLWDFGDGTTSTQVNPSHTYNKTGDFKVKLFLKNNFGCQSNAFEKTITVIKVSTANFETLTPLCVGNTIKFSDLSTSVDNLIKWQWDFGDSSTSDLQNPSHVFTKSGIYNVKLTVNSFYGCVNTISKTVKISDPATIDFTDPSSCINDLVDFKGLLLIGDASSWLWDFGDGSSEIIEKTKQNTQHKYLSTGIYNVSLTTSSSAGCITTITKPIKISGSNPKVLFEVLDKDKLCSNNEVSFKNKSTIVFGNITKLEIIYDFVPGGANVIFTDNNPAFDKVYTHKYPVSALSKNYQVIFRAYSGQNCFQESTNTITVNASPKIIFSDVKSVCFNSNKILLTDFAKETTGISGMGVLSGKGIVGNFFDPAIAGLGSHEISYVFTSTKGCVEQITRTIIVNDIPKVDAGEDLNILFIGEKEIKTFVSGNVIKYKWSPSLGLSNDSIPNPIASPEKTTKYTLTITSKEGCEVTDEVTVNVFVDPLIPNAFSPNNDGINDTWVVNYLETFVKGSIKIFNRYGQQVFKASPYDTPWDGRLKGEDMPVGVYYYIIEPNNGRNRYTGSITLIR